MWNSLPSIPSLKTNLKTSNPILSSWENSIQKTRGKATLKKEDKSVTAKVESDVTTKMPQQVPIFQINVPELTRRSHLMLDRIETVSL
jgi:hypothetical protein